jgi:hypothetical protein
MPFTYLGLPLGTTRPSVQDYLPLVSRIERRLMGITLLLSYAGRLKLVNSVLSAMPTFHLCTLKIHITVIEQIDIYRKHCLWDRGDINRKGGCLVAWSDACKAKKDGGLGIIDLHVHSKALLVKFIHKFYNREDLPCVSLTWESFYSSNAPHLKRSAGSFWGRDVMSVVDDYFKLASCNVHCGTTVSLCHDFWGFVIHRQLFPQLFYFAKKKMLLFSISLRMMWLQTYTLLYPQLQCNNLPNSKT